MASQGPYEPFPEAIPDAYPLDAPPSYAPSDASSDPARVHVAPSRPDGARSGRGHALEMTYGFPAGLFVLRNRSCAKVLDVRGSGTSQDTEIIAYTLKRPTMVEGTLLHKGNNQLFFLDWRGNLCAANSSLFVDVLGSTLHLSSPSPICPTPTPESHPPPHFRYDPLTATISVDFDYDPSFAGVNEETWKASDYLLEIVPKPRSDNPPSSGSNPLEKFAEWLPFTSRAPAAPVASTSSSTLSPPTSPTIPSPSATLSNADADRDDSPDPMRQVRVVSVAPGWRDKFPLPGSDAAKPWLKRQWDVANIYVGERQGLGRGGTTGSGARETLGRHPVPPDPPRPSQQPPSTSRNPSVAEGAGAEVAGAVTPREQDATPLTETLVNEIVESMQQAGSQVSRLVRGE